jgi:hypothetical protein
VAATWHPTRNGNLTPQSIVVYSNCKICPRQVAAPRQRQHLIDAINTVTTAFHEARADMQLPPSP